MIFRFFFFFQAEDGIRDLTVTGVQTCALPILRLLADKDDPLLRGAPRWADRGDVSVRGVRRSLDEALPKWSEISGNLDKSSKTTYDCLGREIQKGDDYSGVAAVKGDALAGGEQGGM